MSHKQHNGVYLELREITGDILFAQGSRVVLEDGSELSGIVDFSIKETDVDCLLHLTVTMPLLGVRHNVTHPYKPIKEYEQ